MAEAVERALREKHHLIAEAGTGVGKSFAYLVPAILAVTAEQAKEKKPGEEEAGPKKRIIISTHTITLQEQLLNIERGIKRHIGGKLLCNRVVQDRGRRVRIEQCRCANHHNHCRQCCRPVQDGAWP